MKKISGMSIDFNVVVVVILFGFLLFMLIPTLNSNYTRVASIVGVSPDNLPVLLMASMMDNVREINIECDMGPWKGDSLLQQDKVEILKNVDPNCIDEYEYRTYILPEVYYPNTERYIKSVNWMEEKDDMGCETHHTAKNVTYFKCPLHNCEKKVVETNIDRFELDFAKLQEIGQTICKFKLLMKG